MAKEPQIYVEGMFVETKETSFGEIIKLSVQADKLTEFIDKYKNAKGYVNIDILNSQKGGKYAVLNQYQPKAQQEYDNTVKDGDLPF